MDFALSDEQRMIARTTRAFVEAELFRTRPRSSARATCRWS